MMMTKKRKTTSNLVGESKPQFARAVLAAALGIVVAVGLAAVPRVQAATITVNEDGSGDYTDIPPAVAAAQDGDTIKVAEGEYTGAEIYTRVKIIGSGQGEDGTRITTGLPYYGDGFDIFGVAAGTEISNLAIEVSGDWAYGIWIYYADDCTVEAVTISGEIYHGISLHGASNSTVMGNNLTGSRGNAIYAGWCNGTTIAGNKIEAITRRGIIVYRSSNVIVRDNTINGFTGDRWWSSPICVEVSQNCTIIDNELIDVYHGTVLAGIRISGYGIWWNPCDNNNLLSNNFGQSGLPGLTAQSDGPFCVLLEEGTKNNFVKEQGGYPHGTNAKTQVVNLEPGYNRIVGHDANQLAQQEDMNPGIGQRLRAIRDASGESEE